MRHVRLLLVFILLTLLVACGGKIEENISEQLPEFEYTTQNGETFGLNDLKGQWWLASFVYTNCKTVCPVMTKNMAKLQQELKENKLDIQIVSFSVDPEFDTPEVLKQYAKDYGVDFSNWTFLTGYQFKTIQDLSMNYFKTSLQKASPGTGNDQIAHGTSFFLVNPKGKIVKKYDGVGEEGQKQAILDIKALQ
ncbi:protein SCO1/2 [Cerasibacillus quisquiliarum]|uniref:Cysteine ABC transporter ATP-binding protein n=1 Tax=Cerasibacillus quisquiliarum TaxID=227865 RepID=A0A511UZW0_9BACI|nr:SCO family protein [Cerasibacillus quisquiliarum]MBB5147292.1 protein SCO1/2 [Cerasibacillus quisquiliarum]GEN32139.1 cysteine ABC transporter ATP-binding protein [Cerasibacillus quisquiliarum]